MLESIPLRDAFWYGGIALEMALLARLARLGLVRRYTILAIYLAFAAGQSLILAYFARRSVLLWGTSAYAWLYAAARPILWTLYFLVILELYSRMIEDFPGLRRLGRMVSLGTLGGVALVCFLLAASGRVAAAGPDPILAALAVQERSVFVGLAALVAGLLVFVVWFRIAIPRNVWVLTACWGAYFALGAALSVLREHYGAPFVPWRNLLSAVFFFLVMLGANLFVSRAGERRVLAAGWVFRPRDSGLEAALALQLQSFNQILVRALRQ